MSKTITGTVMKGHGLGKDIGYPTVNIPYSGGLSGVFVGEVEIDGEIFRAAVHVGKRPTFGFEDITCEAYMLSWARGDIPEGTEVTIHLKDKIRDTVKFLDREELKDRIAKDVKFVKDWYNLQED